MFVYLVDTQSEERGGEDRAPSPPRASDHLASFFEGEDPLHVEDVVSPEFLYGFESFYASTEEFSLAFKAYKDSVRAFVMTFRKHWFRSKGEVGAHLFNILLMENDLEGQRHDLFALQSVISSVLLKPDMWISMPGIQPDPTVEEANACLKFIQYCHGGEASECQQEFDKYFREVDENICKKLNIGDRLGANEHLSFRSLSSFEASLQTLISIFNF